jgi:hypothetical protein
MVETIEERASFEVTSQMRGIMLLVGTDLEAFSRASLRRPIIYTFFAPLSANARAIMRPIPRNV